MSRYAREVMESYYDEFYQMKDDYKGMKLKAKELKTQLKDALEASCNFGSDIEIENFIDENLEIISEEFKDLPCANKGIKIIKELQELNIDIDSMEKEIEHREKVLRESDFK